MQILRSLFSSKKFLAMLSGLIGVVALKLFKVELDPMTVAEIVALISVYIFGQGISDNGKEAAKITAVSNNAGNVSGASQAVSAIAATMTPPKGAVTE